MKITMYIPKFAEFTEIKKNLERQLKRTKDIRDPNKQSKIVLTLYVLLYRLSDICKILTNGKIKDEHIILASGTDIIDIKPSGKRIDRWMYWYGNDFKLLKEYL